MDKYDSRVDLDKFTMTRWHRFVFSQSLDLINTLWFLTLGSLMVTETLLWWKFCFFFFNQKKDNTVAADRIQQSARFTPTIVPVHTLYLQFWPGTTSHPRSSAAGSWLSWFVFALSDVGYALWDSGHHALQRLCQTDLTAQTRSAEKSDDTWRHLLTHTCHRYAWTVHMLVYAHIST